MLPLLCLGLGRDKRGSVSKQRGSSCFLHQSFESITPAFAPIIISGCILEVQSTAVPVCSSTAVPRWLLLCQWKSLWRTNSARCGVVGRAREVRAVPEAFPGGSRSSGAGRGSAGSAEELPALSSQPSAALAPSPPGQSRWETPLKQCWDFKVDEQRVVSPALVFFGTAGLLCWSASNKCRLEQVSVKENTVWKGCRVPRRWCQLPFAAHRAAN